MVHRELSQKLSYMLILIWRGRPMIVVIPTRWSLQIILLAVQHAANLPLLQPKSTHLHWIWLLPQPLLGVLRLSHGQMNSRMTRLMARNWLHWVLAWNAAQGYPTTKQCSFQLCMTRHQILSAAGSKNICDIYIYNGLVNHDDSKQKVFPRKYCCDIQYKVVPPQLFIVLLFYIPHYLDMYIHIYIYVYIYMPSLRAVA